LYPYLTSGCSASENDFDYDSDSGGTVGVGSLKFTSRGGSFTQTIASASLSTNNSWVRNSFSGWTSDQISGDYRIWTLAASINSYTTRRTNRQPRANLLGNPPHPGNPADRQPAGHLVPRLHADRRRGSAVQAISGPDADLWRLRRQQRRPESAGQRPDELFHG